MKRLIPLLLAGACHLAAHAAGPLPAHVAGSWGSAQTVMYLQADGDGLMAGSAPPANEADNARPIIGFPVHATLDGDTLLLRPSLPNGAPVENVAMTCRYDAAAPAFTCTGPDKTPFVLHRLGATLPAEATSTIAGLKAQQNGS
ncbi:hypothetical protein NX786_08950 [Telluria mixta]|uniref:DUF2147 domain-containing protein n=1 Tax=Telluria mixta TaxID=34071 RepID=A0ABT2BWE0_9BURK|nr:hypothetical protein [Telluria mixta]MCS0629459.1 hypothetical protein [Telluria mixta]WEM96965.1 hypothetical protein P0M04_04260 [Telluria mixta]